MKKPSIFSKNYEKAMKRRRKIRIMCTIFFIFLIGTLIFIYFNYDYIHSILNGNAKAKAKVENNSFLNKDEKETKEKEKKEEIKEEKIVLKLKEKIEVKANINKEDQKNKKFKDLSAGSGISYEFNNNRTGALLFIKESSEMFLVNTKGEIENISCETFENKNGTKIKREDKLKKQPDFIWAESPKLYNKKVFYLSKLPNSNNYNRYFLWMYDMKSKKHTCLYDNELRGKEIKFGEISGEGLQVKLDGHVECINEEGKINKQKQ